MLPFSEDLHFHASSAKGTCRVIEFQMAGYQRRKKCRCRDGQLTPPQPLGKGTENVPPYHLPELDQEEKPAVGLLQKN
ncbi:hypothetical protein MUG91_G132n11 [Manis pentadactyla]|nr:hypothetical protein MUG91_G132n11 [Manis pentadactyla]